MPGNVKAQLLFPERQDQWQSLVNTQAGVQVPDQIPVY